MRKIVIFAVAGFVGSAAHGQSTTNCTTFGSTVRCSTTPDTTWQNQQMLNQGAANLGAAIAARRERKHQERADAEAANARANVAAHAAAAEAAKSAAISAAWESDKAVELPAPPAEQPVFLACTMPGPPISVALYEKHNRVDETVKGVTKTRSAKFSTAAVAWETPLMRFSLNRVDGSFTMNGNIPAIEDKTFTGTCAVASQRKF